MSNSLQFCQSDDEKMRLHIMHDKMTSIGLFSYSHLKA